MTVARHRLEELSILNVLFCMLVVLIHVLSHPVSTLDRTSWQYAAVLISQRLAFVSVPGFFFLSGLKLTLPRENKPRLGRYYLGRIRKLLLPYLLAAVIYYFTFVRLGWYSFSPAQFVRETTLGTLSAQFYFLIALTQFILLAPLFRSLSQRYSPVLLLPMALGITLLSSMYLNIIPQLFSPGAVFVYGDRIFTSYLIYYLAGCCAGQHYPRCLALLEENRSLIAFSTLFWGAADAVISGLAYSGRRSVPYLELVHTLYILSAIPLLLDWARRRKDGLQGAGARLLQTVDRASYLIYLYHCLVIALFNNYVPLFAGDKVSTLLALRFLVVYPVSIGGCILWQRLWAAVRGSKKHHNGKVA